MNETEKEHLKKVYTAYYSQIVYCYLNRQIMEFSIEILGHDAEKRIACMRMI